MSKVTNLLPQLPWKSAGVMGLGLSGTAAAAFLARRGAAVVAADAKPLESLPPQARELDALGVRLVGSCADAQVFRGCEVIIASPGVPPSAPPLAGARMAGIPVLAEVELAARHLRGVLIGITGSNGKSTVTTLTGRILEAAGLPVRVCGNIGTALTAVVEQDQDLGASEARRVHYVVELSSFQLEGIERMSPRIAAVLNLSPDHQDRYETTEAYYAAKARIFMNQRGDDVAVLNWDDPLLLPLAERLTPRLFPFSGTQDLEEGAVIADGALRIRRGGTEERILNAREVPMPGRHNLENVLAASAIAAHCNVSAATIAGAVAGFRGLPHRLEFVADVEGVAYYNDSKATNVGATQRALESFSRPMVLLLGGYDKGGDFESLRSDLAGQGIRAGRPARVRAVVTFGQAGSDIASRVQGAGPQTVRAISLADAVKAASGLAQRGDVVLLAPGCASFDAYTGYEQRGEDFRSIVKRLASQTGGQA